MPVSVVMPALGESVTEGTVTRWLKKEGETVEVDEPLVRAIAERVVQGCEPGVEGPALIQHGAGRQRRGGATSAVS